MFVLGVTQGHGWGWTSTKTIGVFIASAVLLLGFVFWERRAEHPLVPFSIFRLQTLTAVTRRFHLGTALFSMFLMLTLYMQQVLGLSPLETGVGYFAVAGTAIIWANVAAAAVTRVGVKPALVFGMSLFTVGLLYFTQVSADGSYWKDLFPGFLIIGLGMPFAYVPIMIAAVAGTKPQEAGLASGLINTSQQSVEPLASRFSRRSRCRRPTTRSPAGGAGRRAHRRLRRGVLGRCSDPFAGLLVAIFLVRGRDSGSGISRSRAGARGCGLAPRGTTGCPCRSRGRHGAIWPRRTRRVRGVTPEPFR